MRMHLRVAAGALVAAVAGWPMPAHADIVGFTDQSAWLAAAGPVTELTFTDYSPGTIITSQYAGLGITFTDGDDSIYQSGVFSDGYGLLGFWGSFGYYKPITAQFDGMRNSVAVTYPAEARFKLYDGDTLVGQSGIFIKFFTGPFAGVVSTVPFDRVVLEAPSTTAAADSYFFGTAIPAPGTIALLGIGAAAGLRSRRSRS